MGKITPQREQYEKGLPPKPSCVELPKTVNILGIKYTIEYCDNPVEVDINKRESFWGQIDFWTRTIRIYRQDRPVEDIWQTLFHEIIHGLVERLHMKALQDNKDDDEVDLLAMGLTDVLIRNEWLKT